MSARGAGVGAIAACLLLAAPSAAAVNVQTSVSARQVEVGETFYLKLSALSDRTDQPPAQPTLTSPPGISVSGPSVASQTQMTISNGQMQQRVGLNATWQLTATRTGKFRIGPATVAVGGGRVQGEVIVVEVVAAGSKPRRGPSGGRAFDPFDLLDPMRRQRHFPGFRFDFGEPEEDPEAPQYPEEFGVERAGDPIAFLRATLAPQQAVVGEQVTLRVYAYGSRGPFGEAHLSTEPSRGDFIGYQLGDRHDREMYQVPIDDVTWIARKVREFALFPIRAGTLEAGKMTFGFDGPRYGSQGTFQGLLRSSDPATVVVSEPPLKGRPAGYKLGDVGDYELSVKVEPRELTQGESVSVIAKIEGVGNVPSKLRLPERRGIVWGEPSVIDKVEPNGNVVQGFRVFTHVVRIEEAGSVELGEITLPYWNPKQKAYAVARANLDRIEVKKNPQFAKKSELAAERDSLKNAAISVRKELGASAKGSRPLADQPWYWGLLLAGPLGVLVAGTGARIFARLRERAAARKHTHERLVSDALQNAAGASAQGDNAATAGAIERALFAAIEGGSGLKARALLKSEIVRPLIDAGYDTELAERTQQLLERCDALRFTGTSQAASEDELLGEARRVAEQLRRSKAPRSRVAN